MLIWHDDVIAVERGGVSLCMQSHEVINVANMKLWVSVLVVLLSQQTLAGHECDSDEFECDDGSCEYDPFNNERCDSFEGCDDGSDEDGCLNILAIAIGVSIGGFVLFTVIPIAICVIVWCCIAQAVAGSGRTTRTVVATTPPPTTAVATTSTTQQSPIPLTYPIQGGYPPKDAPPPYPGGGYPPQPQPGYHPQPQPTYPGYPPQEGYPLQETAAGYPDKELEGQLPGYYPYPPQEAFPPPQP